MVVSVVRIIFNYTQPPFKNNITRFITNYERNIFGLWTSVYLSSKFQENDLKRVCYNKSYLNNILNI